MDEIGDAPGHDSAGHQGPARGEQPAAGLSTSRGGALRRVPLLLIGFAVFLALRAWGIEFGQPPRMAHPDERYAVIAERMSWGDLNPHYFLNPPLTSYVLFGVKQAHALAFGDEANAAWIVDGGLAMAARWLSALLGALTALLVGAAARALMTDDADRDAIGLAAAVITGFSFLHGRDSHYGVNDVPMVFFVTCTLYATCRGWREGRGWLVAAACAAGVAGATKYNGMVAAALPAMAWMLGPWATSRGGDESRTGEQQGPGARRGVGQAWLRAQGLPLCGGFALLAFVLCNPFSVLAFDEFAQGFQRQFTAWGDKSAFAQYDAPGAGLYLQAGVYLVGYAHLAAALGGLWLLVTRTPRRAALVGAVPLLYLAGMLSKDLFYYRFALPLLPFLALSAAPAWVWSMRRLPGSDRAQAAVLVIVVSLASAQPALSLLRHDWLAARDDTWIQAVDWLEDNVPPDERVFLEGAVPRIRFPSRYRVLLPPERGHSMARIVEPGPDGRPRPAIEQGGWLITDSFNAHLALAGDLERRPQMRGTAEFLQRLATHYELVAEFAPGPRGDPTPFVIDARYSPLVGLWDVERPGFTVRVFRIEPGTWRARMGR